MAPGDRRQRTLLVAGRSGQVATCLARRRPPEGWQVVALGREQGLDITDETAVRRSLAAHRPDVVVNAAAYTAVDRAESEPEAAFAVNRDGAAMLARACAERDVPFVHISTDYVFDGDKAGAYVEDDPIAPLGIYGASKAAGEDAVRAAAGRHLILRTSWVYSPFGSNFVKTIRRLAETRDEITVVADQHGCPTAADDIAAAILTLAGRLAAAEAPSGTFHMAGTGDTTWHGFAEAILRLLRPGGGPPRLSAIGTADYPTAARRPKNSRLDCSRLAGAYGLVLPPWQESLRRCVAELSQPTEQGA